MRQRSKEWLEARVKLLTASDYPKIMKGNFGGVISRKVEESRGEFKEINSKDVQRGRDWEEMMLMDLSKKLYMKMVRFPEFLNIHHIGCSPDGFVIDDDGKLILMEVKAPKYDKGFRDEWIAQVQFSLWVINNLGGKWTDGAGQEYSLETEGAYLAQMPAETAELTYKKVWYDDKFVDRDLVSAFIETLDGAMKSQKQYDLVRLSKIWAEGKEFEAMGKELLAEAKKLAEELYEGVTLKGSGVTVYSGSRKTLDKELVAEELAKHDLTLDDFKLENWLTKEGLNLDDYQRQTKFIAIRKGGHLEGNS